MGLLSPHGTDVEFFIFLHTTLTGSVFPVVGVMGVERQKHHPGSSTPQALLPPCSPSLRPPRTVITLNQELSLITKVNAGSPSSSKD